MATDREKQQFRDLINRWIGQDRAKRLILEAQQPEVKKQSLAERALASAEEFIDKPIEEEVIVWEETLWKQARDIWELFEERAWPAVWDVFWLRETEFWKDIKEKFWTISWTLWTVKEWLEKTIVWTLESWKEIFEWLTSAWQKKTLDFANVVRKKLGKKPLTIETATEAWLDPVWWLQKNIQEDLLDIWQGSLGLWFTALFPWVTAWINTITETKWWEELFGLLSTAIGKWWKFINKLPWFQNFREALPEEKKWEFDNFVWQVATLWVTKIAWEWIWKLQDIRTRSVEEIWANILKPTPKTPLDLESATRWLEQLWPVKPKSFNELADLINTKQNKDFPALKKWLEQAQNKIELVKDVSVWQALDWLVSILEKQPWKKFVTIRNRVKELQNKHEITWLTLKELQEVKTTHTQQNNLFSELWKETWWFTNEWLRAVRDDIKVLIEEKALEWWFKNVKEINSKFWELENAKQFIILQEWALKSYLWRQWKQSLLQDTVTFVLELPWVKQWFTAPVQTAFWKLSRSLREWKVNPIEVQKQLPALFKELRKAWVSEWTIQKINNNIVDKLVWIDLITWWEE